MTPEQLKNEIKSTKLEMKNAPKLFCVSWRFLLYCLRDERKISKKLEDRIKFAVPEYKFYYDKINKKLKLFDDEFEEDLPKTYRYQRFKNSNKKKRKRSH